MCGVPGRLLSAQTPGGHLTNRMDHSVEMQIRAEIYRAFETLGADKQLLGIIGSWGDTLEDAVILDLLKTWNSGQYKASWKTLAKRE